jgi:hypothetical protein
MPQYEKVNADTMKGITLTGGSLFEMRGRAF